MQLKIQRSQRMGGALGGTVLFCLDVRAAYDPLETSNIARYRLGNELIYSSKAAQRHAERASAGLNDASNMHAGLAGQAKGLAKGIASLAMAKMSLNITIASLGRGHHIECKDLAELMEAEETVMQACRNIRDYLQLAASFNGSTVLVDFSNGEEVSIAEAPPALPIAPEPVVIEATPVTARAATASTPAPMPAAMPPEPAEDGIVYSEMAFAEQTDIADKMIEWLKAKYTTDPVLTTALGVVVVMPPLLWIFGAHVLAAIVGIVALAGLLTYKSMAR